MDEQKMSLILKLKLGLQTSLFLYFKGLKSDRDRIQMNKKLLS
jgi:hypothetical protein